MIDNSLQQNPEGTIFENNFRHLYSVSRHIAEEESLHPEATGEFTALLHDLMFAVRIISRDVRRAGLNDVLGLTRSTNVHGEQVRKLDKYSNEVIKKVMSQGGRVCAMACEEEEYMILPGNNPGGDNPGKAKYVLLYDPLDGSSNIDVNINIGTIFSIYKRIGDDYSAAPTTADVLQPGFRQLAAGYALYGSSTILVYTTGHGVHEFTFDPTLGDFLLTGKNIKIPFSGNIYSVNEGNYFRWTKEIRDYVDYLKFPGNSGSSHYNLRYIATGVADIHRTLHNGGIYLYPADSVQPEGKFRLIYEANPLAMIIEQAGGMASNGVVPITNIVPEKIHQKTPLFIGSQKEVTELTRFISSAGRQ